MWLLTSKTPWFHPEWDVLLFSLVFIVVHPHLKVSLAEALPGAHVKIKRSTVGASKRGWGGPGSLCFIQGSQDQPGQAALGVIAQRDIQGIGGRLTC